MKNEGTDYFFSDSFDEKVKTYKADLSKSAYTALELRRLKPSILIDYLDLSYTSVKRMLKFETFIIRNVYAFCYLTNFSLTFVDNNDGYVCNENSPQLNPRIVIYEAWGLQSTNHAATLKNCPVKDGWKIVYATDKVITLRYTYGVNTCKIFLEISENNYVNKAFFSKDSRFIPTSLLFNRNVKLQKYIYPTKISGITVPPF